MAFWGAPAPNPDHAVDCCRAALACQRAMAEVGLVDDHGQPVKIRIGINSGDMLVGNIGSEVRLNYTVIGDAVNIASRLESTNKVYGSTIIIGPETRRLAGDRIVVRELDRLAVYGRAGGLQIYELLAMADEAGGALDWVKAYEAGLASWRAREFTAAIAAFETGAGNPQRRCGVIGHDRALQAAARESRAARIGTARPSPNPNKRPYGGDVDLKVLLTHTPQARAQYYGERSLSGLQAIAQVQAAPGRRCAGCVRPDQRRA